MRVFLSSQFAMFLFTGGIAASVNWISRIVYSAWLSYSASIFVAYVTGMITAFLLARIYVFPDTRQSIQSSVIYFSAVNVLAVAQVWLISMSLARYVLPSMGFTDYVEEIAHAVGVVFPVLTSYLGHKYWSFR